MEDLIERPITEFAGSPHPKQNKLLSRITAPTPVISVPSCLSHVPFAYVPGSDNWFMAVVSVDPSLAAELLELNNAKNRKQRKNQVIKYTTLMRNDLWETTPEALVYNTDGLGDDGQHRLSSVIASDTTQNFLIVLNVPTTVYKVLDRGLNRSPADALNLSKKHTEVARLIAKVVSPTTAILDQNLEMVAEILKPPHDLLMDTCSTTAPIISCAGMRAAACMRMLSGTDPYYITSMYRDMVLGDVAKLPTIGQAFMKLILNNKIVKNGGTQPMEMLARGMELFDFDKFALTRIHVKADDRMAEIRSIIETELGDKKLIV